MCDNLAREKLIDLYEIEDMFKKTTICKRKKGGARRYYKGKPWTRVLWDIYNPKKLCRGYDIHHINEDKLDDRIENLERLSRKEHIKLHKTGSHHSEESKQKMFLANIGKSLSDETKKKISIANIGRSPSIETRKKLSIACTGRHHSDESRKKMSLAKFNMSEETKKKMSLNHADVSGKNGSNFGNTGYRSPNAKKVMAEYQIFSAIEQAGRVFDVKGTTISYRIRTHKPGYFYL